MKYCVVIMDGAADRPLPGRGGKTCLELAQTPNLDAMARKGIVGLARTVPPGMEPSSACACMSVLGYDPAAYYKGRATIEAKSMGITVKAGEVVFRCNLVAIQDGKMFDYSSGHIGTEEARQLITTLNERLGNDKVSFYPGISYRHICKLVGQEETLAAVCTPAHDIPGKPVAEFLPQGPGSDFLRALMKDSEEILKKHPVNIARQSRGEVTPTSIWLFWGSGVIPDMPSFQKVYGLRGAMTTGVDLLRGLAQMVAMDTLDIPGVNDALDNDYTAQVDGALRALDRYDLAIIHIEAPDESGHGGSIADKVEAIQRIDRHVLGALRTRGTNNDLRVLVMPDHPTPIELRTHSPEPVPFLLWGPGFSRNNASRFTEAEGQKTGLLVESGYTIMNRLVGK